MPLISRYTTGPLFPLYRTTGVYGHRPKNGYVGYVALVTKNWQYQFFYGLTNPYRPGKIVERFPRRVPEPRTYRRPDGTHVALRKR